MQTLEFSQLLHSLTKHLTQTQTEKVLLSLKKDNKAHLLQQLVDKKSQNRTQCPHFRWKKFWMYIAGHMMYGFRRFLHG